MTYITFIAKKKKIKEKEKKNERRKEIYSLRLCMVHRSKITFSKTQRQQRKIAHNLIY